MISPLDPRLFPRIGTVDDRFQSYNVEMVEVIGGRFWKPYAGNAGERAEGNAPVTHAVLDALTAGGPRVVERMVAAATESRLEDARVIVSGGRGIGGPEPFKELQEIAALIGGQVAASRAACDAGWVPPSWQVGQTGKKVAPGLYLAIAIHGASQHLVGISDAKVIAAINIDPDAPIFKHCSFGIVEDYRKVIPLLREQLASRQQ